MEARFPQVLKSICGGGGKPGKIRQRVKKRRIRCTRIVNILVWEFYMGLNDSVGLPQINLFGLTLKLDNITQNYSKTLALL